MATRLAANMPIPPPTSITSINVPKLPTRPPKIVAKTAMIIPAAP